MDAPKKPPTRLERKPGEDIWTAMARELADNPDSPVSLRILSGMNRVIQPRNAAASQLVEALAQQLGDMDPQASQAAVDAAIAHWEKACGAQMTEALLEGCRADARELARDRQKQPPPIESIVAGTAQIPDVGYTLGVHSNGLRGTWHRLWASISTARHWGETQEMQRAVATVRDQLEQLLGRALSPLEWEQLTRHAHHHCDTVMRPALQRFDDSEHSGEGPSPDRK